MSVSTSIPRTVRLGRSHPLVVIVAIAVIIVASTWAVTSHVTDPARKPPRPSAQSEASVLRSLTPQERRYVTAIASLSPAQLSAAFGTDRVVAPTRRWPRSDHTPALRASDRGHEL